jgi:tetratricopeptide (TPR) repeat protein
MKKRGMKKLLAERKRIIEISLAAIVLTFGLAFYFTLSRKKETPVYEEISFRSASLNEAINAYRLEEFDRAELLFRDSLANDRKKKVKSRAALYLGNISYRRGDYGGALEFFDTAFSLDDSNIYALYNGALSCLYGENHAKALRYAQKAYRVSSDFLPNTLLLGNLHYATGDYEKALAVYSKNSKSDPLLDYNHARTLLRLNRIEEAVILTKEISKRHSTSQVMRGLAHVVLGEMHESHSVSGASYFRQALEIFPRSSVMKFNLAVMLERLGRHEESAEILQSIEGTGLSEGFLPLYGRTLYMSGRYEAALDLYSSLNSSQKDVSVLSIIGDIYLRLNRVKDAEQMYRRALQSDKDDAVFINLVRLVVDNDEYEKAEELCRREIEGTPDAFSPLLCLAEIQFRMKNRREAKKILEKAITVAQENVERLLQIALVYRQNGYHNNALHLYHRVLTLEPSNHAAKEGIAGVFLRTGHLEKTAEIVRDMRPATDDIEVYYTLSMILAGVESPETGEGIYKKLIQDYPYRHEAYLNLCLLFMRRKTFDAAISTAQDCLKNVRNLDQKTVSDLYTIIASAHFSMGDVRESLQWLRKAHETDGENEAALINMKIIEQYI